MNIKVEWTLQSLLATGDFHRIVAHAMRWGVVVCLLVVLATAGMAQAPSVGSAPDGGKPQKPLTIPAAIRFDAASQGPLLWVFAAAGWTLGFSHEPPDAASVAAYADRLALRIVALGSLTVLAPTSMYVIEENPGPPDPYSGLRADERLKVLMSLFTAEQWAKAGSADGIGAGDLNEDDAMALSPALQQKVDAAYRSEHYTSSPAVAPSDLPPALEEAAENGMQYWAAGNIAVRRDKVLIDTRLKVEYKLPGDLAVEAPYSQNIHFQYLQGLAKAPQKTPAAAKAGSAPAPSALPESLRRRVVLVQLPQQSRELTDFLDVGAGSPCPKRCGNDEDLGEGPLPYISEFSSAISITIGKPDYEISESLSGW